MTASVSRPLRALPARATNRFPVEYSCDSPTERRDFLLSITAFSNERNDGAVATHVDISQQNREEERLRRFADLTDAITDAVYLIDRATGDQRSMLETLGCDEMRGFPFSKPRPCDPFASRYLAHRSVQ